MATKNIMIVGVGGQGTLLTSRILGGLAIAGGYDVKLSEVHGMAQRGGRGLLARHAYRERGACRRRRGTHHYFGGKP